MYIDIGNECGHISLTPEQFETFRNLMVTGQKVPAIKMVREIVSTWGLLEAKDFVYACTFAGPHILSEQKNANPDKDKVFIADIKDDVRAIILAETTDYQKSLLLDLFSRLAAKVGFH